ncbi:MAG: M14 family metallopeptidase [Acidobacteriota bacterium]
MRKTIILATVLVLLETLSFGQRHDYYPGADYDPAIPTLEATVGHDWGDKISSYADIETYAHVLAEHSPKVNLVSYGQTWEGRKLYLLIVSSEANLARLEEIRQRTQQLAYPEGGTPGFDNLPCTVSLMYGIHGNEISSPEAGLLTAYHLAAARNDSLVKSILDNCIVLIDPIENPDGRNRFVQYFEQTRGRWPDENPEAAERNEVWPGGRSNHYLFDMNRDWFALTQPETRGRVATYLKWFPQVVVDLHEMGGDSTYYFAPPAVPINPQMTDTQLNWLREFGRNNARWFDRLGIDYFTREVYDSFYPGYGEEWPAFQGSVGMTYEQASVRGLVLRRSDDTVLHYSDSIAHHFDSSLSTLQTASRNREKLLRTFAEYRRSAIEQGRSGEVKEVIFPAGAHPDRVRELVNLLLDQGIEVRRTSKSVQLPRVRGFLDNTIEEKEFAQGTFFVPFGQPAGRLARNLLLESIPMDEPFLAKQERRYERRERAQFYDVTAWSLPLLYDVECFAGMGPSPLEGSRVTAKIESGSTAALPTAKLAYVVPWGSRGAARLLATLLREGYRVYESDRAFSLEGHDLPAGSLIVKTHDNADSLHSRIQEIANDVGAEVYATDSGWVESGPNFGSEDVHFIHRPKVALAYNVPTRSSSTGAARYIIEQLYDYPVTTIETGEIPRSRLDQYNVLILPDAFGAGGYSGALGQRGISRLKAWVRDGGTLITFGQASRWLTDEKVGLLATELESRKTDEDSKPDQGKGDSADADLEQLIQPKEEAPARVPGALVRVRLDPEQWQAFGYGDEIAALIDSNRIFTPLKLDKGVNVGVYYPSDQLLLSGFLWEDSRNQLGNKAFLMYQPSGRGHVIAFAEDPTFRGFLKGQHLLLMNALFFGPAH